MDIFGINAWEMLVLLLLAMFIFGPDRLPKAISDGVKMVRNLRDMARNATTDLSRQLGTEVTLEDLNPKALIRKHILSEEDERVLRKPLEDLYRDVRTNAHGVHGDLEQVTRDAGWSAKPVSRGGPGSSGPSSSGLGSGGPGAGVAAVSARTSTPYQYDVDAT